MRCCGHVTSLLPCKLQEAGSSPCKPATVAAHGPYGDRLMLSIPDVFERFWRHCNDGPVANCIQRLESASSCRGLIACQSAFARQALCYHTGVLVFVGYC